MWTHEDFEGSLDTHQVDALILYGTEGSTARRISEDIGQALYRHNVSFMVRDMQFADPAALLRRNARDHTIVIVVVSTAGQGEMPISARQFWTSFLKMPPNAETPYGYKPYAVFGLGDRKYPYFNWAAKKFVKRLQDLGVRAAAPAGLGDDSHVFSHFGELDSWIVELLKIFDSIRAETTPCDLGEEDAISEGLLVAPKDAENLAPPRPLLSFLQTQLAPRVTILTGTPNLADCGCGGMRGDPEGSGACVSHNWVEAEVTGNHRLTVADHFQDVRRIELQLPVDFNTGDILCVWPRNAHPIIDRVFESFGWDPESRLNPIELSFIPDHRKRTLLERRKLRDVFRDCLDLMGQPSRAWLYNLGKHCPPGLHRDKLMEFASSSSPDALSEYMRYIVNERRSLADVLVDFSMALSPSVLRFLLTSVPLAVHRKYSIANAPHWYPCQQLLSTSFNRSSLWNNVCKESQTAYTKLCRQLARKLDKSRRVDLCVAVKQDTTFLQRKIQGTCSTYLARLKPGDKIICRVEPPSYDVASILKSSCPLLFFGTGTGCAPLRALLQHIYIHEVDSKRERSVYLGFRREDQDFLFRRDWELFAQNPNIKLYVAFSRADEAHKKIYIQDLVEEHTHEISNLLSKTPKIFIAGRSHPMPAQLMDSLTLCCSTKGKNNGDVTSPQQLKRGDIIFDTWGV